jgi:PAS domain S-box-containing protein
LDLLQNKNGDAADWLFGGGEMGDLIRAFDWSATALGPRASWPQSLRLAVGLCLNSRFPMHIWWGPELIYLYNDAHSSMLAKRHPSALGRSAPDVWPEVWPLLAPQVEAVMQRGESTWNEQVHVVVERNGFPEDGWFTWSYSPIRDESGAIVGLYDVSVEETPRVLAQRERDRLAALRELQLADEHARAILESITDAFFAVDSEWRFTYVNPLAERVLGRSVADLMRKVLWDEYPGLKNSALEAAYRRAADERVAESVTSYFSDHDRWYEVHAYPASEGISVYFRDVSESKNAQAALAESEAKFRQLADSMPQIVWAALPDGTLNYYNRRWFEYIDLNPNVGEEARWDRYIHPDDLQATYEAWTKAIQSGEPYGAEFRVRRADGQYRWFLVRALPVRDGEGKTNRWFGTCTDIDDYKYSEAALRHSREQMEIVVKGANVGVWYCPLPFDKLIWDATVKEHFHLPFDAEVTIDIFYERIHPEDRDRTRRAIEQSIGEKQPYDIDYRTVSPDGASVKWIRATGRGFYDAAGNPTRFDGITSDVTARALAEQRVRRLYAVAAALSEAVTPEDVARVTVHQGIAAVGATAGSLVLLSEDGANMEMAGSVGYPAEVIGRWKRFPVDAPLPLAEAAMRGEPVFIESPEDRLARYPALAPLNANKATNSSACLPLKSGGRTIGTLGLSFQRRGQFTDDEREFMLSLATQCAQALERARLFEAERHARAGAERASQMKDEFLATLSHELRTPLNAILGWSQILSGGARNEEDLAEGIKTIERNARAQTTIIEDLLDMSRIISGKVRLDVQRVDLSTVMQAASDTVKPAADAKGIRVQLVLDPMAGPVSGDPNRLQQVFWNLLTNAVKFTPRGGRVQVLLERVNSHLEVSVTDTGDGIAPEFLPHVFERFRQADGSTTRRHGGLGLGLAIVKQLVELHGGSIRAKSPGVGHGATFTVSLPLTAVHEDSEPSPQRRHPSARNGPLEPDIRARIEGVKVLVVDDEADARALVKRLLEDCKAVVTVAASVAEALERILAEPPDVLVSDIGMPGEDGYSLIRQVRALGPEQGGTVPAVALTAYARAEDRMKAIMAGFQHHVAKPVEPAELITIVASLATRTEKGSG